CGPWANIRSWPVSALQSARRPSGQNRAAEPEPESLALARVFECNHEADPPAPRSKHYWPFELESRPRCPSEVTASAGGLPRCVRRGGIPSSSHGLFAGPGGGERYRKRGYLGRGCLPLRESLRLSGAANTDALRAGSGWSHYNFPNNLSALFTFHLSGLIGHFGEWVTLYQCRGAGELPAVSAICLECLHIRRFIPEILPSERDCFFCNCVAARVYRRFLGSDCIQILV